MTVRFYSSTAPETTLQSGINNVSTVILVASTVGFPVSTPYTLALDYGAATEELVDVTGVAGLSLTVTRAVDGTAATSHGAGAKVRHVSSARDFRDSRDHENASTNVHGLSGGAAVVGTTTTQSLSNKTIVTPTISDPTINGDVQSGVSIIGDTAGEVTLNVKSAPSMTVNTFRVTDSANNNIISAGDFIGFQTVDVNAAVTIDMTSQGATIWKQGGNNVAFVGTAGDFDSKSSASALTSNLTAATGWTTTTFSSIKKNSWLIWSAVMTRTGAAITANAVGNITDTTVGTITPSMAPHSDFPATPELWSSYTTTASDGSISINPDTGIVTIWTLSPTGTISTGGTITFTFMYPVGTL